MKCIILFILLITTGFAFPIQNRDDDLVYNYGKKTSNQILRNGFLSLILWDEADSNNFAGTSPIVPGTYYAHLSLCLAIDSGTVTTRVILGTAGTNGGRKDIRAWTDYTEHGSYQSIDVSAIVKVTPADLESLVSFVWLVRQDSGVPKTIMANATAGGHTATATFYEFYLINKNY